MIIFCPLYLSGCEIYKNPKKKKKKGVLSKKERRRLAKEQKRLIDEYMEKKRDAKRKKDSGDPDRKTKEHRTDRKGERADSGEPRSRKNGS